MATNALGHSCLYAFWKKTSTGLKKNGELKINDNALVALALHVAQSDPVEKELMIQLIVNLVTNK